MVLISLHMSTHEPEGFIKRSLFAHGTECEMLIRCQKCLLSTVENLSPIRLICFACVLSGADLLIWARRIGLRLSSGVKILSVGPTVSAGEPFSGGPVSGLVR